MIVFKVDKAYVIAEEARTAYIKSNTEKDPKERSYWEEQLKAHLENLLLQTQKAIVEEVKESPELIGIYSIAALEDNWKGVYAEMLLQHLKDEKIIPE